jgi:hypothetical protein
VQVPADDVQDADVDVLQLFGHMLAPQRIMPSTLLYLLSSVEVYLNTPATPATKKHHHNQLEEMIEAKRSNNNLENTTLVQLARQKQGSSRLTWSVWV